MSLSSKNSCWTSLRWAWGCVLMLLFGSAQAGIVIDYAVVSPSSTARRMPGIVVYPGYAQTETGYQIQRSHAWRLNRQGDPRSGAMLVYPLPAGSVGISGNPRQQDVRTNLSRAHAYRLDYYKR